MNKDEEIRKLEKKIEELKIQKEKVEMDSWTPSTENIYQLYRDGELGDVDDEGNSMEWNGWKIECVERFGGYEGSGEEHYIILKFIKDFRDSHWKVPGYYASYNGAELEWDSAFQVTAKERTIIVWE